MSVVFQYLRYAICKREKGWMGGGGVKREKNGPKCQKFLSVAPYISGTIYHMIFIYGTHVCIKG